jgi:hypothetical protein
MQCREDPSKDQPQKPPEGVYTKSEQPRYSQMMASLADQVKSDVGEQPEDWYRSYMKGIEGHHTKVQDLQKELQEKLAELEKEEGKKITSDSIHTGFDKSSVSKEQEKPKPATKPKAEAVEVLNPGSLNKKKLIRSDSAQSSGADADVDEPTADAEENHDDDVEASPLGKEFAKIKPGDYKACLDFISQHREVVAEKETDGLLIEGFNAQMDGKAAYAKQCVHQALLLQYCRTLGRDGVGLFFKRYAPPSTPSVAYTNSCGLESPPWATKPKKSSSTTSPAPTPGSAPAPPKSPASAPPTPPPPPIPSSRSSSTPSTPAPRSTSTSPNPPAATPSKFPPAPSSRPFPQACSARSRAGSWRKLIRCWGR